jgi:PTH2 family peptidyl-tRNA hydrolase
MKQVIVVDTTLQLPRGKLAAQVAHAAVAAFLGAAPDARRRWLEDGMPKIVLKCEGEPALLELEMNARKVRLPVALIRDAGRTVLASGTATCVGIGPAEDDEIDAVTGALKLL